MDAFFAFVEQRDNPELWGKPIAVTGRGERTVITTSLYEARAYGVRTGMTTYEAKRLCPHLIFVVGNNRKYAEVCKQLEQICLRFTPELEIYSIDEVFLDITLSHHLFGGPETLGASIKAAVKTELGLTCTVGLGPNILVAKLASDLAKPDGLRWIDETTVPAVFETLPVKKLWGIGSHTEEKLRAMGITTCGQLGRAPLPHLVRRFGVLGEQLKAMGNGILDRPLETGPQDPKSIGHSITLPNDIWKREEMASCLLRLSERVGQKGTPLRLQRQEGHPHREVYRFQDLHETDHPPCPYQRHGRGLPLCRMHPRQDTSQKEREHPRRLPLVSFKGRGPDAALSATKRRQEGCPRKGRRCDQRQVRRARGDPWGEHRRGERPPGHLSGVAAVRGEKERRVGRLPCRASWAGRHSLYPMPACRPKVAGFRPVLRTSRGDLLAPVTFETTLFRAWSR
jgi:nucleotidyltransferase/DNA polymerase involved in DNA repair